MAEMTGRCQGDFAQAEADVEVEPQAIKQRPSTRTTTASSSSVARAAAGSCSAIAGTCSTRRPGTPQTHISERGRRARC
eukprot:3196504-Rhodomonas_salina.1